MEPRAICAVKTTVRRALVATILPRIHTAGVTEEDCAPGFGLIGMRERVALLNGTLKVGPEAGHGWRVVVVIPLMLRHAEQAAVIAPAPHEA